jgi:hypothetical protein
VADSAQAVDACNKSGAEAAGHGVLRTAFETSGPSLQRWHTTRNGPTGPRSVSDFVRRHAGKGRIYACFFDDGKDLATPTGEGAPPHNRVLVLVDPATGEAALDSAGYHGTPGRPDMPVQRIPESSG